MALAYSLAGIAAGYSGQLLSSALQTPGVILTTALIFVLLALSMFGFYELKLPASLQDRVLGVSSRLKGGQLLGVFVMGAVSALIVSPCVAAPLAGALLYISQTHDVMLGGIALFALSIGMGVPLLLIGISAGSLLPKTGKWMNSIRNMFGVLLIGVAIWLITPLISVSVQMGLWAALLIIPAIYMRAIDRLPENASNWMRLWKAIGLIMLLLGVTMLIGAISGAKSPLQPLSGLSAGKETHQSVLAFQRVKNVSELEQRLVAASGKVVMLDFYADWCVACKEMEQFTFSDPRVQEKLKEVILLQADVTENNADDRELLKRFGLFGPPGLIFFERNGQESRLRIVGYQDSDRFLTNLSKLGL
jgi:thiol:disulfide interchange protein DsbD